MTNSSTQTQNEPPSGACCACGWDRCVGPGWAQVAQPILNHVEQRVFLATHQRSGLFPNSHGVLDKLFFFALCYDLLLIGDTFQPET